MNGRINDAIRMRNQARSRRAFPRDDSRHVIRKRFKYPCWSKAGSSGVKYLRSELRLLCQIRLQLSISDILRTCVLVSLRSRDRT